MQDASRPAAMRGRYMDETDRSPGLAHRVWDHRADYLYVLPALIAMLVVIAYPIYYTIELSFYRTPPSLQLSDKIFVGLRELHHDPDQPVVLGRDLEHDDLDVLLDPLRLPAGPRRGAGAAPRIRGARRSCARSC